MIQADDGVVLWSEGILRFIAGQGYLETGDRALPMPVTEMISIDGHSPISLAGQRARWVLYVPDIQV